MYCPKCGSNQSEGKKFCTICGTNLQIITQALNGQLSPVYSPPPVPHPYEIERQREIAKGLKLSIIGGGFLIFKFFSMMFSGRSFLGTLSFVGFILLAVGVSRLIAYRTAYTSTESPIGGAIHTPSFVPSETVSMNPQPVYGSAPRTSELSPGPQPTPSVTEDETRRFPHHSPQ